MLKFPASVVKTGAKYSNRNFSCNMFLQEIYRPFSARQQAPIYNFTRRNRSALLITETELKLIAAPAIIGLSSTPKNG